MINPTRILKCFGDNFIGIEGYCDSKSDSGYFLNREVNITRDGLAKLATGDDIKGIDFFKRIQKLAIQNTAQDYLRYLNKYANFHAIKNPYTETTLIIPNNEVVKISPYNDLHSIEIKKVKGFGYGENMYIEDFEKNVHELRTKKQYLSHISDQNEVYLYFNESELIIEDCSENSCGCLDYKHCICDCFEMEVATIPNKKYTHNYEVTFSCECSFEELICMNKSILAESIYYHTIGLYFKEKWLTNNCDYYINTTKDQADHLYHEYLKGFESDGKPIMSEYHKALKFAAIATSSNIHKMQGCFSCTGSYVANITR